MLFIVSPAKKMVYAGDAFEWRDMPSLLAQTHELLSTMRRMSYAELKALWDCSDALADLNFERVQSMDIEDGRHLSPAVFSYEGIQYQNMAPQVMTAEQLEYLQEHLRILSGFYGVVRPFDGVVPYRLEMQAKLSVSRATGEPFARNLYEYWGPRIFELLRDKLAESGHAGDRAIVNLASVEYAKAVEPYAKKEVASEDMRLVTCLFGSMRNGKFVQRATEAKAARGTFVRWCAENSIEHEGDFPRFDMGGYRFSKELSSEDTYVFVK